MLKRKHLLLFLLLCGVGVGVGILLFALQQVRRREAFSCVTFKPKVGTPVCYNQGLYFDSDTLSNMNKPQDIDIPYGSLLQFFGKSNEVWTATAPTTWDGSFALDQVSIVDSDLVGYKPPSDYDKLDAASMLKWVPNPGPWESLAPISSPTVEMPFFTDTINLDATAPVTSPTTSSTSGASTS